MSLRTVGPSLSCIFGAVLIGSFPRTATAGGMARGGAMPPVVYDVAEQVRR